jgi:hypothetical protein
MDKYLERLVKQLEEISEVVGAFNSEAVQLRVVAQLLPALERNSGRNSANVESDNMTITKTNKLVPGSKEKKPGLKKSLINLIQNSFFEKEKSIGMIVEQLNTTGHNYLATQISGILLSLIKEGKLKRYQSPVNNRFVYVRSQAS